MNDEDKGKRIREYEERKRREEQISNQALEMMGKVTKLAKVNTINKIIFDI